MSVEKAREFLKALDEKSNYDALEAKVEARGAKGEECEIEAAVEMARELGYDVTGEEIVEALQTMKTRQREKTEKAVEDLEALDDDSLEDVAGGIHWVDWSLHIHEDCKYDFTDDDCWSEDACELANVRYFDCEEVYFDDDCFAREYSGECILGHVSWKV